MSTDYRALCTAHLAELRGMFERILCVARSSDGPAVGNIQLADRLIDAVVNWSENSPAQPEPAAPTDEELTLVYAYAVAAAVDNKRGPFKTEDAEAAQLAGLRAVLARYARPTIQPVPVSERLPRPEDCDAEGRCWIFMPDIGTDPSWRLTDPRDIGPYHTHWFPATALLTPEAP